mmetsp:Transcript_22077/g.21273  ORF Transcript_22077/g.21273 Transcript_22077/m.21273 type:complete len:101 (+) Transcript_22077:583-885(+)
MAASMDTVRSTLEEHIETVHKQVMEGQNSLKLTVEKLHLPLSQTEAGFQEQRDFVKKLNHRCATMDKDLQHALGSLQVLSRTKQDTNEFLENKRIYGMEL